MSSPPARQASAVRGFGEWTKEKSEITSCDAYVLFYQSNKKAHSVTVQHANDITFLF